MGPAVTVVEPRGPLVERGGRLAALQQMLGNSSDVTTQSYARLADDMVLREAERLEAVV